MKNLAKLVSLITLSLVVVPCLLYFADMIGLQPVKWTALLGTLGWFISTPMWMSRETSVDSADA